MKETKPKTKRRNNFPIVKNKRGSGTVSSAPFSSSVSSPPRSVLVGRRSSLFLRKTPRGDNPSMAKNFVFSSTKRSSSRSESRPGNSLPPGQTGFFPLILLVPVVCVLKIPEKNDDSDFSCKPFPSERAASVSPSLKGRTRPISHRRRLSLPEEILPRKGRNDPTHAIRFPAFSDGERRRNPSSAKRSESEKKPSESFMQDGRKNDGGSPRIEA